MDSILELLKAEIKKPGGAALAEALGLRADDQRNAANSGEERGPDAVRETDLGNAKRLVARHGVDLRFCQAWGKWLAWDERRWRVDDTGEVERRAKDTVRSIYLEARNAPSKERAAELAEWAVKSESAHRLNAMIDLARSEPGIPVVPEELDRDPWLLNCLNGTVDLRTGKLRPHRREDMITKIVPVVFNPDAEAPLWDAFLDRIMGGNERLIGFLQRAAGYSLTGDVSEHVAFLCYGTGQNGKSVFLNTLLAATGDYGKAIDPELLLARTGEIHPTIRADLAGVRLAVAIETQEGRRLNEALFKWLTGGDRLKARRMREDFWEFEPTHKFFIATNHKPEVRDTSWSLWRRIRLIPFTVTIPEEEQDKHLAEKLRDELPGILAWAVRGCVAWQEHGLAAPEEVKAATEQYRAEQDMLMAFIEECCIQAPYAEATAGDLYRAYTRWCETSGEKPLCQRDFGARLGEKGFKQDRSTGGVRFWRGIGLVLGEGVQQ